MIYDLLDNLVNYKGISPELDTALDYLIRTDLRSLPLGRTEINGDGCFVNVMEAQAGREDALAFEIHRKYMDIQIDVEGDECIQIGSEPEGELTPFNPLTDFGTVRCAPAVTCTMGKGRFIICMAGEPHKPGIQSQENPTLRKCVVKVMTAAKQNI